jgi:multidrug resistance efflux pump
MSREYAITMRHREAAEAASALCAIARAEVDKAHADDFLLREIEARTAELLESRQTIERAKRALADARAALIQGAWTDGTLSEKANLAEAVCGLLAGASA